MLRIESFVLSNSKDEILFSCNCLKPPQTWDSYIDKITNRIPVKPKPNPQIYVYDDLVIAVRDLKTLKLTITAPITSMAVNEASTQAILDQFEKIVTYCCKDEVTPENVMERDHYIKLQMLIQQELSTNGFMRMIPESEFESVSSF